MIEAHDIDELNRTFLNDKQREEVSEFNAAVRSEGLPHLEVWFSSLPRKIGRIPLKPEVVHCAGGIVDLGACRACDLAAAAILLHGFQENPESILKLYQQGDAEERRMILKSLCFMPPTSATTTLLLEAHRTNDQVIFEAGLTDSDLPSRVLSDHDYGNAILKAAFTNIDPDRLPGMYARASSRLSSMLLEFMEEREAAGRTTWAPSLVLAAHAPCEGLETRITGHLLHPDPIRRSAAGRAAGILGTDLVREGLKKCIPTESDTEVLRVFEEAYSG